MTHGTFIEYQDKGFWIHESFIEVLSQFICETFENIGLGTFNSNLIKIYNNCNSNRSGANAGMVNILFDEYIANSTDRSTLINVLEQTKDSVLARGTEINVTELNQFENNKADDDFKDQWSTPIKTQSLASTLSIMQTLLNGSFTHSNHSIQYQGFPDIDAIETV